MTGQIIIKQIVLFTVLLFVTSGYTLFCNKCEDTPGSSDCSEVQECFSASPNYLEQFKGNLNIDSSKPPKPVCFTSVVTYNGDKMSTRGCSVFGSKFTCDLYRQKFERSGQTVASCDVCEFDFCNSDSKISTNEASIVPQGRPLGPQSGPGKRPDIVLTTKLPSIRPTEFTPSGEHVGTHVTLKPLTSESKNSAASIYGLISVLIVTFLSSLLM